jgi:hypothetical protein
MKHPEYELQKMVCRYLELQYPSVLFLSDVKASVKLTIPQARRNKAIQKHGFKCPDLLILERRGGSAGLLIELKIETPFKKDGGIKASQDDHLKLQLESLMVLNNRGYTTAFRWTFEQCKTLIDQYMALEPFQP